MKMDIDMAKETLKETKKLREKSEKMSDEWDQLIILNQESNLLKDTLKILNAGLTRYIEAMKDYKRKKEGKRKYGIEDLPEEYLLKVGIAEDEACQKLISNLTNEYQKLKHRLQVVGDLTYSINLRKQIMEKKRVNDHFYI